MRLIDANLLLYAYDTSSPRHDPAYRWLGEALQDGKAIRLATATLLAFVRIATHRRVFERPLEPAEACAIVASWLELPAVSILQPGPRHWSLFTEVVRQGQAHGALIMDAHLAALAIEHGATLYSTDRDFTRFPGLTLVDPLR